MFLPFVWTAPRNLSCNTDNMKVNANTSISLALNSIALGSVVVKALCYKPQGRGFLTQ
jgi:hypothetical protein